MDQIREVYFLGSDYKIAQIVDRIFTVKCIYCEQRLFNISIYNFSRLYSIDFNLVETAEDLKKTLPKIPNNALGISYGFGIIFKKAHMASFKYGIWNIHTGDLPGNRGRHPVSWDFLKGRKEFTISIHEISEAIDRGFLLAKDHVNRDLNDTQIDIENKFELLLENGLLKKATKAYFSGKKKRLCSGIYNKSLANVYKSIVPGECDSRFMFNLCKSQFTYGGILVNKKRYFECVFYNDNHRELYKEYDIFKCKDGEKVGLK